MPSTPLGSRVAKAAEAALGGQGFVDPIGVLAGTGRLTPTEIGNHRTLRLSKTGDRGFERAHRTRWVPARP